MASSLRTRAERRADRVRDAIGRHLKRGDSRAAFNESLRALQGEMTKLRRWRGPDGKLADAEVAASLAALASQLHAHKPSRPPGCPPEPRPEDLQATFDDVYARSGGDSQ